MSLFTVDENTCTRCGACVEECPPRIIAMNDAGRAPVPVKGAGLLCINCFHCVAVCPHGSLSHKNASPGACPPVRREWLLSPEQAAHFLRSRRSIRTYRDTPVEKESIAKLIDIARYAPSGHNSQPVEWMVAYDTQKVRLLADVVIDWMRWMGDTHPAIAKQSHMDMALKRWEGGLDAIFRGAPHVALCHAPKENMMAQSAATIALAYLELAAPSFGLGACWAGYFHAASMFWPPMVEALGLPEGHVNLGALMLGYPKHRYHRLPPRNEPRIIWR